MSSQIAPAMQSMQRYMILGAVMFGCVIFGMGGWATTTQLSGAVIAQGLVVVDSSVKKVQHATGGIVGELRVREGDRVNEGDILVRLDETMTRANLQIVVRQLDELLARQARLEAERDGSPVIEPVDELTARMSDPAVAKLVAAEKTLFDARRAAREGQKSQLNKRISQLQDEIEGLRAQQKSKAREAVLIE